MSVIEKSAVEFIGNTNTNEDSDNSLVAKFFEFISSVRLGIVLLIIVGLLCFLGMIIVQQNVDGFDRYYAELTPAQKLVYGSLGLFDIYGAWYFGVALVALSLNIILSSIERFPKTWSFYARPKLDASAKWLKGQSVSDVIETTADDADKLAADIAASAKKNGWRKAVVTEKNGKTFIFAERGMWNRFGYLAVHVGLLIIFAGGFMTFKWGNTGSMMLQPGQKSNEIYETVSDLDKISQITKRVPFDVACTDIQQKLIKNDGSLSAMNTIDWITKIQIKDEDGVHEGVVQMNRPFDYRGYRFFQSSFVAVGRARNITLQLKKDADGSVQEVSIPRDGTATLADGTVINFNDFRGAFSMGKENPNEDTSSYPMPAAVLQVTAPGGKTETAYAFTEKMGNIPIASKVIAGYTYRLKDFEKVGEQHILSVQRDPGADVVYVGFIVLFLTLVAVFFFSHQRVWALVEKVSDNSYTVTLGGNTNRNQTPFSERFRRFAADLRSF